MNAPADLPEAVRLAARVRSFGFEAGTEILAAAYKLEAGGRDIVHLDLGEPDFPTPRNIVEVAERAIESGRTHYTPPGGLWPARVAAAEFIHDTRGLEISPQKVIFTSGSTQGLMFTMLALVEEGSEVIVPDPGYPIYAALVQIAGGTLVPVSLREDFGFGIDLDELRAKVSPRTS